MYVTSFPFLKNVEENSTGFERRNYFYIKLIFFISKYLKRNSKLHL